MHRRILDSVQEIMTVQLIPLGKKKLRVGAGEPEHKQGLVS